MPISEHYYSYYKLKIKIINCESLDLCTLAFRLVKKSPFLVVQLSKLRADNLTLTVEKRVSTLDNVFILAAAQRVSGVCVLASKIL